MNKKVHVVSVISLFSGIVNTVFTDLEEAEKFYDEENESLDSDIYTVYLEENVDIR